MESPVKIAHAKKPIISVNKKKMIQSVGIEFKLDSF